MTSLPVQDGSILCEEQSSAGWSLTITSFHNVSGALRNVVYDTNPDAPSMLVSVMADVPVETDVAEGSAIVTWNETDDAPLKAMAPGASVVGPRSHELSVENHFLGVFSTGSTNGTIRDPSGGEQRLGPGERELLVDLEEGEWGFELGPSAGVGSGAERNYLAGVLVPTLGVAPDRLVDRA